MRPDSPAELQRIVDRALAKKRTARYGNAAELLAELSPLSKGSAAAVPRQNRRLLLYAGVCLAAAGIVAVIVAGRSGAKPPAIRMEQITAFTDSATNPSLSTDGRMPAFIRGPETFTTPGQVYVKQLPGGDAVQLTKDATKKMHPVFSPDGSRVAYTVVARNPGLNRGHGATLFKVCPGTGLAARPGPIAYTNHTYDVAPDGRFLINCLVELPGRFIAWMNWRAAGPNAAR